MRLFLAINLPTHVRLEVVAATAGLRERLPEIAWVGEPQLHLTLKFLGNVDASRLDGLSAAMAHVAGLHRELVMNIGGIGAFPNFRRARIVWMGVDEEPRLELLHHDVEVACESLGFEVEGRAFRPHLTIGRVKHAVSDDHLQELSRLAGQTDYRTDFVVRSVDLMSSEPSQTGSIYRTLVSAALRSG